MTMGCAGWAISQERVQGGCSETQQPSWLLLTRESFTSKLKEHEFSLCIAALPWCGESRSLMKDILKVVKDDLRSFPGLQLFFVHINEDRLLGKVILGGSIPPSFTLFRYGTPYKYAGRRSTSSIMASVRHGMTVLRSDTVLLHIESPQDLNILADSTDKAVLLFDFCGWELKLQQKLQRTSIIDDVESMHSEEIFNESQIAGRGGKTNNEVSDVDILSESRNTHGVDTASFKARESSYRMQSGEKQIKIGPIVQDIGHKEYSPMIDASFGKTIKESVQKSDSERKVGERIDGMGVCMSQSARYFISGNAFQDLADATIRSQIDTEAGDILKTCGAEDLKLEKELRQDQLKCSSDEYEIFEVVYRNVSNLAADNILTPRRTRFAIVTSEDVTSRVGISTLDRPWLLMYLIHDFDRLPYSFNGVGKVEDFLIDHSPPLVFELEGEGDNSASSAMLNDSPSVILFIDRMSNCPDVQEKSNAALVALQALSYHYASLANDGGENRRHRKKYKGEKRRISEAKQKVAAVHVEEQTTVQTVEPQALLTLLEESNLHTGRLRQADGHVVFELQTEQHQSRSKISGNDVVIGNRDVLLAKLAQPEFLEEKVGRSLANGADFSLLPMQLSGDSQLSDHPAETLGHRCDKDLSNQCTLSNERSFTAAINDDNQPMGSSSLGFFFEENKLWKESLLDVSSATTDESVLPVTSVPTQVNLDYNDGLGSNTDNDINDVGGKFHYEYPMETACVEESEGTASCSEKQRGRFLLTAKGESPQVHDSNVVSNHHGKSRTLHKEADIKPTNEEYLQQFVTVENDESGTYWNGLGFYFIDGEDPMKEKLARSKETPALVIIDPERQAHYRFPSDLVLNVTTLSSFVENFVSRELKRKVFSEPEPPPHHQPPRPPFINQDFHDMYLVPRVTVNSFSKLITGVCEDHEKTNQFTLHQAGREESKENGGNLAESIWDKDVLVLFTTPWCGFCKRMELIVREVYRSFQLLKGHEDPPDGRINRSDDQQKLNGLTTSRPPRGAGGQCTVQKAVKPE